MFPLYRPIIECCVSRLYFLAIKIVSNITKALEGSADTIALGLTKQGENIKLCRFNENIYEIYILSYHSFSRHDLRIFVVIQVNS